jgi:hypothetical protein
MFTQINITYISDTEQRIIQFTVLFCLLIRIQECVVDPSGLTQAPLTRSCDHVNEPSSYIESGESIDLLSDYQIFNGLCSMELIILTITFTFLTVVRVT